MAKEQQHDADDVVELQPDFALKNKIGKDVNISEIFNTEAIKASQQVINDSQKDFLKWVENDLRNLESYFAAVRKDQSKGDEAVTEVKKAAFSIKAQSGTFGFDLGSAVAKSLYDFCENNYTQNPDHLVILRKHIDTLKTIFHKKIVGDGGKVGAAVHTALGKLIKKYGGPTAEA